MQCACATLSCVAWPAVPCLYTLSHKQHDFRKKKNFIEHKMCFDFLTTFVWKITFLILRRIQWDPVIYVHRASCKLPLIFVKLSSHLLQAGQSGDWIPVGGEISRTRSDRPWGPPSLIYNGYRGKATRASRWPPSII